MERPAVHASTGWPPNYHGSGGVPKVMALGHKIRNLVERTYDEINELHFANRPQAEVAHATRRADDGALADRRINYAFPAKAFEQPFAGLERAAIDADVFTDQQHSWIAFHLLKHGLPYGFEKGDLLSTSRRTFSRSTVRTSHDYLRAFREVLAAPALAARFFMPLPAVFAATLGGRPLSDSVTAPSIAARVSPKWMGASAPPELLPEPKPATLHTALTLDRGGVTSATGRSHLAWILWQSSPVQ